MYEMYYKNARMTLIRDALNDTGRLNLIDISNVILLTAFLDMPNCGSVNDGLLTFSSFPRTVSCLQTGTVAYGQFVNATRSVIVPIPVGIPGSGARIILDNESASLSVVAGNSYEISVASIQHA